MISMLGLLAQLIITTPQMVKKPLRGYHPRRDTSITYLVIHYDSGASYESTRKYLIKRRTSYHYYITRNGTINKLIEPTHKASHAGLSLWDGHVMLNRYSIGICLQNLYPQTYTDEQYNSLVWLVWQLQQRFPNATNEHIVGHEDIAFPRGRKKDPGPHFDWHRLFAQLQSIKSQNTIKK